MPREGGLTPVHAAVQGIVQYGAAQGGEAPAAPQVGLAHHGLAVVGGLGAGGGRQALRAARFPPDRPARGAEGLISHAWLWGGGGGGGHGVPTGEKTGNSPQSLGRHRFPPPPPRQVSEGANRRFVNSPPARPRGGCRHRFRSHRCGFPARHLQRISLPPSRWRRLQPGRGTQPPTTHPPTHGSQARVRVQGGGGGGGRTHRDARDGKPGAFAWHNQRQGCRRP